MNRYKILRHPEQEPYTSEQALEDELKEKSKAWKKIERWDLKVNTIICSVCGAIFNLREPDLNHRSELPVLCEHLAFIMQVPLSWFHENKK